jgi:multidrug resistance efflux pump
MLIVLAIYAVLIWLIFFQLKLLPWSRATQLVIALVGLLIVLVVVGLLNIRTPSGRVTIVARINQIAPVVGGIVANIPVEPNKLIDAGAVLLEIDKRPYQYAVDEAQATLQLAKKTLERKQEVFDRGTGAVTQQSLDESRSAFDQARARLNKARYDLEQTVVKAPAAGTVTSLGVSVGDQARPLDPVIPFVRNDTIFLAGVFSQNGLGAMPKGTPVRVVLNSLPGRIFSTEVVEIATGTASGQLPIGAELLSAADIGSDSDALVVLAWPKELDPDAAIVGTVGSATAFGSNAGAMGLLATVLLYIKMLGTYL